MTRGVRECPFAIVPAEAARDHRLTAMQFRVLIAILTFRNRNSDTVYPKRAQIARRSGYSVNAVSRATAGLEQHGWLEKVGKGGRSSPTMYRVTVPETIADPETVAESGTVAEAETVAGSATVADPDSKTVAGSARGKEQTTEQSNPPCSPPAGYPDWFEDLWARVPRRSGSQAKKSAFRCCRTRLAEGYTVEQLKAGTQRYAAWCHATGKVGTEKVMMAKTFFGPEDPPHFMNDWTPPAGAGAASHGDVMAEIGGAPDRGVTLDGHYRRAS